MWTCISNKSSIPAKEQPARRERSTAANAAALRLKTPASRNVQSGTKQCASDRSLLPRKGKDTLKRAEIQLSTSTLRPIF